MTDIEPNLTIPDSFRGKRLDQALAELFPDYSRSRLQSWIKSGYIRVNDQVTRQRYILQGGESLDISIQQEAAPTSSAGQDIPLDVIYTDTDIIVINKPAGLVVHPGAGNRDNTLLNALLFHFPDLEILPRAGIVQRLDKETSGIMVIARNLVSHTSLVRQLQARTVRREYRAIVQGVMTAGGTVRAPIGRHPVQRKKMSVVDSGKEAVTHYRVIKRFASHSYIQVNLESGRTHQIRVHMAHIKYPIVGDPVYGGRPRFPRNAGEKLRQGLEKFSRQALHAFSLKLVHPVSDMDMSWQAPLPEDMQDLLGFLESNE